MLRKLSINIEPFRGYTGKKMPTLEQVELIPEIEDIPSDCSSLKKLIKDVDLNLIPVDYQYINPDEYFVAALNILLEELQVSLISYRSFKRSVVCIVQDRIRRKR